jgi:hypothetical protein
MDVSPRPRLALLLLGALLLPPPVWAAERPTPAASAAKVDAALRHALPPRTPLPERVGDEAFLRRVTLDLTGKIPTPEEIHRFLSDRASDKRERLVERLLGSEAYAVNWGRYWRDALTYNTPASANYIRWALFDHWCVEQFRRNRPWDQVVATLVTASGINDEVAPVNYLTALYGNPVEVASTTSRVFLGVQIQCAQCHDAKTERWKREQFHGFAAFFGRARLIQHKDVDGRGTPYAIESRADGQYTMTDKRDAEHLIPMAPRFLTGQSLPMESTDAERRAALARLLTAPDNPWFARCYVNRMWSALLGWGFYPSVNDLGEAKPRYPEALDALAKDWVASGHDVRWLFRTITRTEAYQRGLQPRDAAGQRAPAVCPTWLRPEQVFEALQQALGFDENDRKIPAPAPGSGPALQRHKGLRHMVYHAFKVDPSLPPREQQGTIPQVLLMMNSALVHVSTAAEGKTVLAELLASGKGDEEIVAALYERVLARRPTAQERGTCLKYVRKVGHRKEALEDVLWALVNSTEFLLKK